MRNLIIIVAYLLFTSCGKNNLGKNKKDYLTITKDTNGFLTLEYKLKKVKLKKDTLRFRYFDYSDNIFPLNGVSVIKSKKFKLYDHTILKDSILFLPVLANNNSLSLNIINLKNKEVITNDLRTSLTFVWIKEQADKIEFIISYTPKASDNGALAENYKYVFIKYELKNDELNVTKIDSIETNYDIKSNITKEFKLINKMF